MGWFVAGIALGVAFAQIKRLRKERAEYKRRFEIMSQIGEEFRELVKIHYLEFDEGGPMELFYVVVEASIVLLDPTNAAIEQRKKRFGKNGTLFPDDHKTVLAIQQLQNKYFSTDSPLARELWGDALDGLKVKKPNAETTR